MTEKTRGPGRIRGKKYPHLQKYPGLLWPMRIAWDRMKAQAKFRKEEFDISWEQFLDLWNSKWHLRGRQADDLCLTRIDWLGPWNIDNVEIVDRREHLRRQGQNRAEVRRTLRGE